MSLKFLAVKGCSLAFENPSASGTISITAAPSIKAIADGKKIYKTPLTVSISAYGVPGAIVNGTGAGAVLASTLKTFVESVPAMRVDDISLPIVIAGTHPSTGAPTSVTDVISITDAGQTKVKGA